jgi:perosamine synthetase
MIPYGKHYIDDEDIQAVINTLRSNNLTQGPVVSEFENSLSKYVGSKYAVAVSSGTAALHLANIAAGMTNGFFGITSPITFVSSANASLFCSGNVLFTDIDKNYVNISLDKIHSLLEKYKNKIKTITPVHFAGLPLDLSSLKNLVKDDDIKIIEDASHALGASYPDGSKVGSCKNSDMTVFSFHPVKAIAAGEGGAITTNNYDIYKNLLRLRSHGINKLDDEFVFRDQATENGVVDPWYYEMQSLGYNYRITDIQCALANSQLKKLDQFIDRRKSIVKTYDEAFGEIKNIKLCQQIGRNLSAHHLYVIKIDFKSLKKSRNQVMMELRSKNIGTQVHYIPVYRHPFYKILGYAASDYPSSEEFYESALSIPIYYSLSDEEQNYVIQSIMEVVK